jgi:hypothetical protein
MDDGDLTRCARFRQGENHNGLARLFTRTAEAGQALRGPSGVGSQQAVMARGAFGRDLSVRIKRPEPTRTAPNAPYGLGYRVKLGISEMELNILD